MTRKEIFALNKLRDPYNTRERYAARDEAWEALQDFAQKHGYGSRFCALDSAMEWLMSSQSHEVRMSALRLYGTYCVANANVDAANHIGQSLADIGI